MPPKKPKNEVIQTSHASKDQNISENLEPYKEQELQKFLMSNDYLSTSFKIVNDDSTILKCNPCSNSQKNRYCIPISDLGKHIQSKSHQKHKHPSGSIANALAYINEAKIELRYSKFSDDNLKILAHEDKYQFERKKKVQLQFRFQMTNFLIKNNLPFNLSENLSKFINSLNQNYTSNELSSFRIDRNNISDIASNFLGPYFQENYLNILNHTPFSLALDEGSLKGNTEYLAISARYLENNRSLLTTTKLISIIQLEGSKTGETIYNLVVSLLFTGEDGEQRKKNCVGVCTDGASNMISTGNASLTSRLQQIIPHLVVIHDLCHVLNLILKDCINQHYPKEYVKIVKNICKKFTNSPKQVSLLRQQMLNSQKGIGDHKVLATKRFVETRWSSFQDALKRILEIKDYLLIFLNQSEIGEELKYLNPRSILMLELLLFLVNLINNYIIRFQKENMDIMEIITSLKEFIMIISGFIYKNSYEESQKGAAIGDLDRDFEDLSSALRSHDPSNIQAPHFIKRTRKEFTKIFLEKQSLFDEKLKNMQKSKEEKDQKNPKTGDMIIEKEFSDNKGSDGKDFNSIIEEEEEKKSDFNEFQKSFCEAAYDFLDAAIDNIKKRLLSQYDKLAFFECFSMKDQSCVSKVQKVASKFSNLLSENEISDLQNENVTLGLHWLKIHNSSKDIVSIYSNENVDFESQTDPSFLHQWKLSASRFPITFKLARAIQVLPYSSVSIERKFSELTDIKTLKRNRLSVENLQACLFVKQECKDDDLTEAVIERYMAKSHNFKENALDKKKDFSQESKRLDNFEDEEEKLLDPEINQIAREKRKEEGFDTEEEEVKENEMKQTERKTLSRLRRKSLDSHPLKKLKPVFDEDLS